MSRWGIDKKKSEGLSPSRLRVHLDATLDLLSALAASPTIWRRWFLHFACKSLLDSIPRHEEQDRHRADIGPSSYLCRLNKGRE